MSLIKATVRTNFYQTEQGAAGDQPGEIGRGPRSARGAAHLILVADRIWQEGDLHQRMNAIEWRKNSIGTDMEWIITIILMKIGWKSRDHLEDHMESPTMTTTIEGHQDANSMKIIQADVMNSGTHRKTCTHSNTLTQMSNERECI